MKSKVYRWYERHDHTIQAVLEMMCDGVPGGSIVKNALKVNLALEKDDKESNHQKLEHILHGIEPKINYLVQEIESLREFQNIMTVQERQKIIYKSEIIRKSVDSLKNEVVHELEKNIEDEGIAKNNIDLGSKYVVEQYIAKGGQGTLYKGRHLLADKEVAIKLLPKFTGDNKQAVKLMREEYYRLVDKLTHESIVQYRDIDFSEQEQQWFLVMDYIDGYTLREKLCREEKLSLESIYEIFKPVSNALSHAHKNNIVHADIKPENILIDNNGKVYLTDFGLAYEVKKSIIDNLPHKNKIQGTIEYMAPEQIKGHRVQKQTDIWQLGVMIYELSSGHVPFKGTSFEQMYHVICNEDPEDLENKNVWNWIEKALEKDYKKRYEDIEEMISCYEKNQDKSKLKRSEQGNQHEQNKQEKEENTVMLVEKGDNYYYDRGKERYKRKLYKEAFECFMQGSQKGCKKSKSYIAKMYYHGNNKEIDYHAAKKIYMNLKYDSDKKLSNEAYRYLASYKREGILEEQDFLGSIALLHVAADCGDIEALFDLTLLYRDGYYCEKNITKSLEYELEAFKKTEDLVAKEDPQALHLFAVYSKILRDASFQRVTTVLERAISKGAYGALSSLGAHYRDEYYKQNISNSSTQSELYKRAVQYYKESIDNGECVPSCSYMLACLLAENSNTASQALILFDQAVSYYEYAFKKGCSGAGVTLGVFYQFFSRRKNIEKSIRYYREAANQHNSEGYLRLGMLYYDGVEVEQNKNYALLLMKKAREIGNRIADPYIEQLESKSILTKSKDILKKVKSKLL